jgi:hypothetical protein
MTTYNTGNPIGSTDARDLYDNAENLDRLANGAAASYSDRLGVSRRSLTGIDAAADNILNSIGYAVPVAYASGITMTLTSQTVDYNGVIYAPKSSALPFTTSSWGTDSSKFRAIQVTDADLITYTPAGTGAVATNLQEKLRNLIVVDVRDYASGLTSGSDWTAAIQRALNELESRGGGICNLPPGLLYISLANSANANSCLQVPSDVIFQGAGMDGTIIQRIPAERGVDGVLITNKYWDTNGGYTAAGNIVFQDFTITDGAASPQRGSGDLIGLGHADNVIVQRVKAGNHDQHFVDICGSKRIKVLNCVGYNDHLNSYRNSSTVQVDGVAAGAIRGIFVDSTVSTDVEVAGNHFVNKTSNIALHIGHKPMLFKNINVHDNYIEGAFSAGDNVITCDTNSSFENLTIANNTIVSGHASARNINFFIAGNSSEIVNGVKISGNHIKGLSRVGVFFGVNQTYTGADYPNFSGLSITNNTIEIDLTGATALNNYGIAVVGFLDVLISGNQCTLIQTNDSAVTHNIFVGRNKNALVTGNTIAKKIALANITTYSAASGIAVGFDGADMPAVAPAYIVVSNNTIDQNGIKIALNMLSGSNFVANVDSVIFSGNNLSGQFNYPGAAPNNGGLIFEKFPASDGTNFRKPVNFGGGSYTLTIASGQLYASLPLAGRKLSSVNGLMSPAKIELHYAPASSADFDNDAEQLQFSYLSATTCAGTQVADVNQPAATFSLVTGVSGVSVVINNTTFQPVLRTSGFLRAFTSI